MDSMKSYFGLEELQDEPLHMTLLLCSNLNWQNFNFIFQLRSLDKLRYEIIGIDMLALHIHEFIKLISMIASISQNDNQVLGRFLPFGPAIRRRSWRGVR